MRHLLSIADLEPRGRRAPDGARRLLRRGRPPRHQEGPDPARADDRLALLRVLDPHERLLRARGQAPLRRPRLDQGRRLVRRQGRVAQGHDRNALLVRARGDRDPRASRGRGEARHAMDRRRRRQRGRRQARAPQPGAARRLHAPQPARRPRRQEDLDRRRRPPQPRCPLVRDGLPPDGRRGHAVRAADADPARRRRRARLRRHLRHRRPGRGGRRLRAADAERAHGRELRPLDPRVRHPLPGERPPPRPAPAPDAPRPRQPRRRALRRGARRPQLARHRAGEERALRPHGGPVRAPRRRRPHARPGASTPTPSCRHRPRSASPREPRDLDASTGAARTRRGQTDHPPRTRASSTPAPTSTPRTTSSSATAASPSWPAAGMADAAKAPR